MTAEPTLYEILGVEPQASQAEIKKAYRKLALLLHPDKNTAEDSHDKFQQLQRIYAVLSDPDKRKAYDRTGSLEDAEQLRSEDFCSLYDYFRSQVEEISEEKLDDYHASYRGSETERKELLGLYDRMHGDMKRVLEWLPCSDSALDSHRFMDTIKEAIAAGEVKQTATFKKWCKTVEAKPTPKDPLKPRKKDKADAESSDALAALIRKRSAGAMGAMADALAAKYGGSITAPTTRKARKGAR